ncbi:Hsp33 family molecular chaperone HslO [Spongiibacter sp.]|uniref:Hsp33 family molecular chaperone HslO n=1 Tax=Spongiibacter sp. TaxID=2024860 RepID=UPI00356A3303
MSDHIHRFIFDNSDVRGAHLRLSDSYRDILSNHHYPPAVARLLGEFLVAAALLSVTIKFRGSLILQVRGSGEVPLIMAEANSNGDIRGIARDAGEALSEDFHTLLGDAQLAITIDPERGNRYQGIVRLDGDSLASCIEAYFRQSEQLATRLWLDADGEHAAGILLQELPEQHSDDATWQHLTALADTVQPEELLTLDADRLLYRLYHQEPLRIFEPKALRFQCQCSPQRVAAALVSLGQQELEAIIAEQGQVDSHCEFCHRQFHFSATEIAALFGEAEPHTRH